jgi:hypothetical protein
MTETTATMEMIEAAIIAYSKATDLEYSEKAIRKAVDAALEVQATHAPDNAQTPATEAPSIPSGWTVWEGGEFPAGRQDIVSFIRRNGELIEHVDCADDFNWGRYNEPIGTDIIAYHIDPA